MELPQRDVTKPVAFAELMSLEPLNEKDDAGRSYQKFRSLKRAWDPGAPVQPEGITTVDRSYGGHVYAQAVYAAAQTVPKGFMVHTVTGFFTVSGASSLAFIYSVRTIRNGRGFCVRAVDVTQKDEASAPISFTCMCSFKRPEEMQVEFQDWNLDLKSEYESVLKGKSFEEHPDCIATDWLWFRQHPDRDKADPFPGLEQKAVDMQTYNATKLPLDRRQLILYRVDGDMPHVEPGGEFDTQAANLHACAHLYASDRNSLFTCMRHFDLIDHMGVTCTLSHTVTFHCTRPDLLSMIDPQTGHKRCFVQEIRTDRAGDGRITHYTRVFDASNNRHIVSTCQDGLARLQFPEGSEPGQGGQEAARKAGERLSRESQKRLARNQGRL